jgi:two-component system CheB/CheR fusion protein
MSKVSPTTHSSAMGPQAPAQPEPTVSALSANPGFPIVGIGASAGGLNACKALVEAVQAGSGIAFILVQHLDPSHESMMVELLAGHTSLTVRQATDGMPIEPDNLYIIAPGTYLSVDDGALVVSQPTERHGARA